MMNQKRGLTIAARRWRYLGAKQHTKNLEQRKNTS